MGAFRASAEAIIGWSGIEKKFAAALAEHVAYATGRRPAAAEVRSWDRSIPVLARDLVEAGLGRVEMLVEYQVPLSSKRADVVLAGTHPHTGEDSYIVIELKQWTRAERYESDDELVLVDQAPGGPRLHPAVQVHTYCDYIADFVGALDGHEGAVHGVAYLHNASTPDVRDLFDYDVDERGQLFTRNQRGDFLTYLKSRITPDPGAADRLLNSRVRPSRQLLEHAAAELKDREQFVLLDEQRLAFRTVQHAVQRAGRADRKEVVVVSGGPGSGKSVIALSLLGELSRQGYRVTHATGSSSFTQTLRKYAGRGSTRLKKLFTYFNSYDQAEPNDLDVLICDEAHRIRRVSATRWKKAELRTNRPQIDELIAAARVPVFLLDEHQVVRPGELGSLATITSYAESLGLRVTHIPLAGQFRCGGSEAYEEWVLRLLGLSDHGPAAWPGDDRYELTLAESPEELEALLRAKRDEGYRARMTAGFCWPWSKPRDDDTLVPDVRVGEWARPWNANSERAVGDAPGRAFWATDPAGFDQVGCVYTAQGFEYDWNGVIIGPDLVARDGRLISVRGANKDPVFKEPKGPASEKQKVSTTEFDHHVRNIYKVLLTRGMVGTVLYSTDAETREYLAALVR